MFIDTIFINQTMLAEIGESFRLEERIKNKGKSSPEDPPIGVRGSLT